MRGAGGPGEKHTPQFFFQCIKPDALGCGDFAAGRSQSENVKAVIDDILGHGNLPPEGSAMLPGKLEADAAARSQTAGGLIFTEAEVKEFEHLASEADFAWDQNQLKQVSN